MNMCADCGTALDRGFVVVIDFKLLCSQQLAILDREGSVSQSISLSAPSYLGTAAIAEQG